MKLTNVEYSWDDKDLIVSGLDEDGNKASYRLTNAYPVSISMGDECDECESVMAEIEFDSKTRNCTACSGSGYYDSTGSPECGACDGTGKR